MWYNYHCHSNFCDGLEPLESYVLTAIEKQFKAIGFSSHAPLWFENSWNMPSEKLTDYFAELIALKKKYASQIEIYTSLELDYLEGEEAWVQSFPAEELDYTILSVHFLRAKTGELIEVDGSTETFKKQLATYWNNDQEQFVLDYFRAFEAMVAQTTPTIIGHFDKIKMHLNADGTQVIDTDAAVYKEASEAALQAIASSGAFLEINTRGMYKKQLEYPYPSPDLLKRAFELNIPLVLNSDAHHPDELDACFKTTAGWLIEMDINRLKVLTRNHWTDVRVTVNGLKTIHE